MLGNSPKPAETWNSQVFAVEVALEWLDQNAGQQRIPMAIRDLLEATRVAFKRGHLAPEKDSLTLGELWRLHRGGAIGGPATPLRASEVSRWWSSRETHLAQFSADRGSEWIPRLVVHPGGGRHHANRFSVALEPAGACGADGVQVVDEPGLDVGGALAAAPSSKIVYGIDPAKPALWLRLVVGSKPFPINSWRGYILLGSAAVNFGLIGLLAAFTYVDWSRPRPVSTADLATLALSATAAAGLWVLTRPIRQLPISRVASAGPAYLAVSAKRQRTDHLTPTDLDAAAKGSVRLCQTAWTAAPTELDTAASQLVRGRYSVGT